MRPLLRRGLLDVCRLAAAALLLASVGCLSTGDDTPTLHEAVTVDTATPDREAVLGSGWLFADQTGKAVERVTETVAGQVALRPLAASPLIVVSAAPAEAPVALTARVRLLAKYPATFIMEMGVNNLTDPRAPRLAVAVTALDDDTVRAQFINYAIADPKAQTQNGYYRLRGLNQRQLGWPEDVRRQVEAQFAGLPGSDGKWLTVRLVQAGGTVRCYLDDRLTGVFACSPELAAGFARAQLHGDVAVAELRLGQAFDHPLYEPLGLDGLVNATPAEGFGLTAEALPPAGRLVRLGDVPFRFPVADEQGRQHLDVGRSWVQHGILTGYLSARFDGPFGGRWPEPLVVNPGRILLSVPKANYQALHLIAAADSEKESFAGVTAQFYRIDGGYPQTFASEVPLFEARASEVRRLPVRGVGGRGHLYHVVIPINPGSLDELTMMDLDLPYLGLELTKETQLYRSYPDPISYSEIGGGLPSSVHVYAATLERAPVSLRLEPDKFGHTWTAPAQPGYRASLRNLTDQTMPVKLALRTVSFDGQEATAEERAVTLAPHQETEVHIDLKLARHGYHELALSMTAGNRHWISTRSLALLHPDTRERGNWEEGRGPIFGHWDYNGGHMTADMHDTLNVLAEAGIETRGGSLAEARYDERMHAIARQWQVATFKAFSAWDHYITNDYARDLATLPAEEADARFLAKLREHATAPSPITRTETISFFPEPHLGPITAGNWPSYHGEPEYVLSEAEQAKFDYYQRALVRGSKLVKQHWPGTQVLLPHGNPLFCIPFLREGGETLASFDGVAVDSPNFERLPEMQTGQETNHRLWQLREEWRKVGRKPFLTFLEGNFVPTAKGALSYEQQAQFLIRNLLHYIAYDIIRLPAGICGFDAADYYGEEHYGNGYVYTRHPLNCPKPALAAVATMTRQLNRANFVKAVPTGSLSVFCLQFKHYRTGELIHVLWTIRGSRPLSIAVAGGQSLQLIDQMDNARALAGEAGRINLTLSASPVYLRGLTSDPVIELGTPNHADARPADVRQLLTNFATDGWQISSERDPVYENNHPLQMSRAPAPMALTAAPANLPGTEPHGKAVELHLLTADESRVTMPWYTLLVPKKPIVIPGRASHLGLWVHAASDWGRVVYFLRDANGEQWISIGTREQWNVDDIHGWSMFCFDGWRYLRFELPGNLPYDRFRLAGTTWWGHFGDGDGMVDLPLRLEKVAIERRTHVLYVNHPEKANREPVMFGDLHAEYAAEADRSKVAVELSALRMPMPAGEIELANPIAELSARGVLPAPTIASIANPLHHADGTQCHVHFAPVEGAASYDVWVSPYADGRGAMLLGKGWKAPGGLIRGLRPETDFYLFLTYTGADGQHSKPSAGFPIRLKDLFFQK